MTQTIGFIGLGNMGLPMAKNLIKAGYHLQVYNRSLDKTAELDAESITPCKTPAQAAANVAFVVSMLSQDDVLVEATTGTNGILQSIPKDAVHISMSTISPDTALLLAGLHNAAGSHYIAAPVFGRPEAAAAQKLFICTSGNADAKTKAKPILEALGQGIYDFGEAAGAANVLKIAGNFMILASLEMMAEAFTLAEKNGLDPIAVASFFGSTLFNAPIYQNYGRLIAHKQYQPVGFKASLGYKDAKLALKLSQDSQTPMPLATLVHNRLLTGIAKGGQNNDWVEAFGKGVRDDAGL